VGANEHGHVGGHLVVARPCRVELAADPPGQLGDSTLDRHVNVLVAVGVRERAVGQLLPDLVERTVKLVALGGGDDLPGRQHRGVRA
jgi:hypothetical protein